MNKGIVVSRWGKTRFMTVLRSGLVCAFGVLAAQSRASQENATPDPPKALVLGATAYIPLATRFVCAAGLNIVRVSPDRRDVLIQHLVVKPASTLDNLVLATDDFQEDSLRRGEELRQQLLLLRPGDTQPQIVWQGVGSLAAGLTRFQDVRWLTGTHLAIMTISEVRGPLPSAFLDDEPADEATAREVVALQAREITTVLLVNAETGKTRTVIPNLGRYTGIIWSRTHPVAILVDLEDNSFVRVEGSGKVGPRLHLSKPEGKPEAPLPSGFLPDGKTLTAQIFETEPGGREMRTTHYQVDSLTGQMTEVKATDNKPNIVPRPAPPFVVQRETATLVRDGASFKVHPLWLEGQDKASTGRVLIAAESDTDSMPLLLEWGILYHQKGALYLVPLLKADAADFLARQQQAAKSKP